MLHTCDLSAQMRQGDDVKFRVQNSTSQQREVRVGMLEALILRLYQFNRSKRPMSGCHFLKP